jgi:hypothetical protein
VGSRAGPVDVVWQHGRCAFAFLCEDWNFDGPERTEDGLAYHRPDLHVNMAVWAWKNESGFTTSLLGPSAADGARRAATLECLYVTAGLGSAYDVPEAAGSGHTIKKRINQHAEALRQVMPLLTGPSGEALWRACAGPSASADAEGPAQAHVGTASVPPISPRLLQRIQAEFPHHAARVVGRLYSLDPILRWEPTPPWSVEAMSLFAERIRAAAIRVAEGRLDRLDAAIDLAGRDWRDLLIAAGLAHGDWADVMDAWLGVPAAARPDGGSPPLVRGEIIEADGHHWLVRRRRLDLRVVRRLLQRPEVTVMIGGDRGRCLRRVPDPERGAVWEAVRRAYTGPAGSADSFDRAGYLGHEFTDAAGATMLYLELRA